MVSPSSDWFWVAITPSWRASWRFQLAHAWSVLRFPQPSFHPCTQIHLVIHGIYALLLVLELHCGYSFLFILFIVIPVTIFLISHLILTTSILCCFLGPSSSRSKSSRFLSGLACFFRRVSTAAGVAAATVWFQQSALCTGVSLQVLLPVSGAVDVLVLLLRLVVCSDLHFHAHTQHFVLLSMLLHGLWNQSLVHILGFDVLAFSSLLLTTIITLISAVFISILCSLRFRKCHHDADGRFVRFRSISFVVCDVQPALLHGLLVPPWKLRLFGLATGVTDFVSVVFFLRALVLLLCDSRCLGPLPSLFSTVWGLFAEKLLIKRSTASPIDTRSWLFDVKP